MTLFEMLFFVLVVSSITGLGFIAAPSGPWGIPVGCTIAAVLWMAIGLTYERSVESKADREPPGCVPLAAAPWLSGIASNYLLHSLGFPLTLLEATIATVAICGALAWLVHKRAKKPNDPTSPPAR